MKENQLLKSNEIDNPSIYSLGAKAYNLLILAKNGLSPHFWLLPKSYYELFQLSKENLFSKIQPYFKVLPSNIDLWSVRPSVLIEIGSATITEDGEELSMAGWFESQLAVSLDRILDSIIKCYELVHSERVIRMLKNTFPSSAKPSLKVNLLIQPFLKSNRSAVVYTSCPFPIASNNEILISSTWGSCKGIVDGSLTGDTFIIPRARDKNNYHCLLAEKTFELITLPGKIGLHRSQNTEDKKVDPTLSKNDITSIKKISMEVEGLFGCPQNIEMVEHKNEWTILQSRPIPLLKLSKLDC